MSKSKILLLLGVSGLLLNSGAAAEEQTMPAAKIGYVHAQRILEETKAGKKIRRELDNLAKEKRAKLEAMKEEILKLDEELAQKQLVLAPEKKNSMEEEIRQKQLQLKRFQEDSLMAIKRFESEALKKINDTAMRIIKKIGEEEKYTLILEVRESNILYADPSLDITDKVIEAYDRKEELAIQ